MKMYRTVRKNSRESQDVTSATQEDQPVLRSKGD